MRAEQRNPAMPAAGRASETFCLGAKRLEVSQEPLSFQPFDDAPRPGAAIGIGACVRVCGALVLVSQAGEQIALADMLHLHDGPAGVNGPLLAEPLARWCVRAVYVEFVGTRPGEGTVDPFAFGRARGLIRGVLAAFEVPTTFLTSPTWKRLVGFLAGRDGATDAARSGAIHRWQAKTSLFARKRDDGRAEATLNAVAGLAREAQR